MANSQNLRKKLRAPAKNRGRVQRAIKRAFVAHGVETLSSAAIYDWAHVRRRLGRRKSMPCGVYSRTLRTLRTMCIRVGRSPTGSGCAILWRLREPLGSAVGSSELSAANKLLSEKEK